jgi:hypothetical protein
MLDYDHGYRGSASTLHQLIDATQHAIGVAWAVLAIKQRSLDVDYQ